MIWGSSGEMFLLLHTVNCLFLHLNIMNPRTTIQIMAKDATEIPGKTRFVEEESINEIVWLLSTKG